MGTRTIVRPGSGSDRWFEIKSKIHTKLLSSLNPEQLRTLNKESVRAQIGGVVERLVAEEGIPMTLAERERVIEEILDEVFGLGPLEPLLKDPTISDILVNTHKYVYIERHGKLIETGIHFQSDRHLIRIIEKIVSSVGRRVDESVPMVDARLPDGSRVNAIIPPLAIDGPSLSIRRFGKDPYTMSDLAANGSLTSQMVDFLRMIVIARFNILVVGGTGSGKTTMLNCLSSFVPANERIVTIEDSAELRLQQPHVVRLETRTANLEGKGEITQRDLVKNSLRMRPERIIVGEVRGAEVIDMLQAMSTGHDGSIATVHANSPREALGRLGMMMMLSGVNLPERAMSQQISAAINFLVHVSRLADGTRKVMKISEITGMEGDVVMMQDLFEYVRTGTSPEGKVLGDFRPAGIRSFYTPRLEAAGMRVEAKLFEAN